MNLVGRMGKREMGHRDGADHHQHTIDNIGVGHEPSKKEHDRDGRDADQTGKERDPVGRELGEGMNAHVKQPSAKGYEKQSSHQQQTDFMFLDRCGFLTIG
jgi:hypothetical protein